MDQPSIDGFNTFAGQPGGARGGAQGGALRARRRRALRQLSLVRGRPAGGAGGAAGGGGCPASRPLWPRLSRRGRPAAGRSSRGLLRYGAHACPAPTSCAAGLFLPEELPGPARPRRRRGGPRARYDPVADAARLAEANGHRPGRSLAGRARAGDRPVHAQPAPARLRLGVDGLTRSSCGCRWSTPGCASSSPRAASSRRGARARRRWCGRSPRSCPRRSGRARRRASTCRSLEWLDPAERRRGQAGGRVAPVWAAARAELALRVLEEVGVELRPAEAVAGRAAGLGRLRRWAGILSAYFSAQTLTQLLGIAAGLLFVNSMPVREFALYTLAALGGHLLHLRLGPREHDVAASTSSTAPPGRGATSALSRGGAVAAPGCVPAGRGWRASGLPARRPGPRASAWRETPWSTAGVAALRLVPDRRLAPGALPAPRDRYGASYRAEMAGGPAAGVRGDHGGDEPARPGSELRLCPCSRPHRPHSRDPALPRGTTQELGPYRRQDLALPAAHAAERLLLLGPGTARRLARRHLRLGAQHRRGGRPLPARPGGGPVLGLTGIVFLPRLARIADDRLYRARCLQFGGLLLAVALAILLIAWVLPEGCLALLGEHYSGLRPGTAAGRCSAASR